MLKNYFKIAIKLLWRNKLYTFISLFGIVFTLLVLMLVTSVLESELGKRPPLSNRDKILFIPIIRAEGFERINQTQYDTTYVDGIQKIDSTITSTVNENKTNFMMSGGLGYDFYKENIKTLKTVANTTAFVPNTSLDTYLDGKKLNLKGSHTDIEYWKIFDYQFIEGSPFNQEMVDNQAQVVIFKESAAKKYFGRQDSYLGKEMDWGDKGKFKVVGVIADIHTTNMFLNVDYFVPFTWANPSDLSNSDNFFGSTTVAVMAHSNNDLVKIETELREVEATIQPQPQIDRVRIFEKDATDMYAWMILQGQDKREGSKFLKIIFSLLAVFVLIPVLNLINLNVTRVFERSAEIGVRKAYGAKSKDLLIQFLFENMIITFLGGLISIVITLMVIQWINTTDLFSGNPLMFNLRVLLFSLLAVFVFGLLSGMIPAIRISRTKIADTLKN